MNLLNNLFVGAFLCAFNRSEKLPLMNVNYVENVS